MKKPKTHSKDRSVKTATPPALRESDLKLLMRQLQELYPMTQIVGKSYVLSRFWAWFTQVQLTPTVRIPVPRFLSQRDP